VPVLVYKYKKIEDRKSNKHLKLYILMNKPENNGFIQQIHQNYKTQGTDGIKPIPKKKREKKN